MPSKIKLDEKEKKAIAINVMQKLQQLLNGNFENKTTLNIEVESLKIDAKIKPKIIISTKAGLKMSELVRNCTKEVGWHGFVEKPDENTYLITDIVVYPQTVTATNVNTDELEYANWLMKIPTEKIKQMRFQGHSHVNMSCNPSSVDIDLYNKYLTGLTDDDFYIFFICNKKGDIHAILYDLKTNTKYNTADITIIKETDMTAWFKEAKQNIKEEKPIALRSNSHYGYYGDDIYYDGLEERLAGYNRRDYGTFPDSWPARVARETAKKEKKSKKEKK